MAGNADQRGTGGTTGLPGRPPAGALPVRSSRPGSAQKDTSDADSDGCASSIAAGWEACTS